VAVVADYFAMLLDEHRGAVYSKTEHRRRLVPQLNGRSDGSIEFKHANISAVLAVDGRPYIDGYKPRGNYQRLLEEVVQQFFEGHPDVERILASSPITTPVDAPPMPEAVSQLFEAPPEPLAASPLAWPPVQRVAHVDFVRRDAENRRLGSLGEEFVFELERRRLHDDARRPDLSKRVEWTARDRGDGAGYDIASFNEDGSPRLIEVKTTGQGKSFPFYVTANEVRCSDAMPDAFQLYRLFRFSRNPGLFVLSGALTMTCALDPVQFRARFSQ
jgi:hypothetical protein